MKTLRNYWLNKFEYGKYPSNWQKRKSWKYVSDTWYRYKKEGLGVAIWKSCFMLYRLKCRI